MTLGAQERGTCQPHSHPQPPTHSLPLLLALPSPAARRGLRRVHRVAGWPCLGLSASPGATGSWAIRGCSGWRAPSTWAGLDPLGRATPCLPISLSAAPPLSWAGPPRHQGPRWREGRLYPGGSFPNPCTARRHCDHPNFCLCGLCTHPGLSRNGLRPSSFHRRCRDNSWGSGEGAPTGPSLASVTLTTTGTGPFYQTAARPPWTRTSAVPPLPTAWGAQAERLWRLAG